jgi:hypothetical protein
MKSGTLIGKDIGPTLTIIGWIAAAIGISVGACAWLVSNHGDTPAHGGAVTQRQFTEYSKAQDEWKRELREDLREIKLLLRQPDR